MRRKKGKRGKRGFASLSVEQRRLVARMGGRTAQAMGKSHVFTHDEAQAAGRKGGKAPRKNRPPKLRILYV